MSAVHKTLLSFLHHHTPKWTQMFPARDCGRLARWFLCMRLQAIPQGSEVKARLLSRSFSMLSWSHLPTAVESPNLGGGAK